MGKIKDQVIRISELGQDAWRFYGYVDAVNKLPKETCKIKQLQSYYDDRYAIGLADLMEFEDND